MQSKLTTFKGTVSEVPSNQLDQPSPTESEPVFSGEIPAQILEEATRHITGYFDHILTIVEEDGVRFAPYELEEEKNTFSQNIEIPKGDWIKYTKNTEERYVAAINPYNDLYQIFSGSDLTGTLDVSISLASRTEENRELCEVHPLSSPISTVNREQSQIIDLLSIGDSQSKILRNPSRDMLATNELSYSSHAIIENPYNLKSWLGEVDSKQDNTETLVVMSRSDRCHDHEYVLTFTQINTDDWEIVSDSSCIYTGGRTNSNTHDGTISNITIGREYSHPSLNIQTCIPDIHRDSVDISWGMYHHDELHGVFKHVLKDTLTDGDFKLKMTPHFPLEISHEITTAIENVDSKSSVNHMMAPVIVPDDS